MMHGALEDITKAVGNTPIVRLNKVTKGLPPGVEIYVKCEYLNPGGSHKDRLAWNLLRRAEEAGLKPGGTIVEATSGNTGASLALLATVRGYKCIFVMPDKMSQEKIAAGPAIADALNAPNSHPDPMMEPIAANSRPIGPTCRLSFTSCVGGFG